ncbi:DUF86 domain-containing protein [Candidatus Poribacteria bacterium]|nr:DUF86 domain-containing protein [Candidatus Poribacteria bacterium]
MPRHENAIRLRDMLDHSREAILLMQNKSRAELDTNRLLNLALVRLLEVIGEAANHVSEEERSRHSEIPWAQIVSLRNRLIHGYNSIDFDILWQIVTQDLPPLIAALEKIIPSEETR